MRELLSAGCGQAAGCVLNTSARLARLSYKRNQQQHQHQHQHNASSGELQVQGACTQFGWLELDCITHSCSQ